MRMLVHRPLVESVSFVPHLQPSSSTFLMKTNCETRWSVCFICSVDHSSRSYLVDMSNLNASPALLEVHSVRTSEIDRFHRFDAVASH